MISQSADQLVFQQVQSVIRRWREGNPADAREAIAQIPGIDGYPSLMIDLAYEQYCLQEDAGGQPGVSMFCAGFGSIASQLRDVLEGHKVLLNNPQLLQVAAWPAPGDQWDQIQFLRELGRGAFARAYLVEDASINRRVVLKLAHRESAEGLSLGTLKHPHVVDILWSRAMNGFHVVAMPYEASTTLLFILDNIRSQLADPLRSDALLAVAGRGEIPQVDQPRLLTGKEAYAEGVAVIAERLAEALDHAQRHGISHGDLKPANVLIGPTGNPYLIDFNLASDANRSRAVLGGTLPYMAPERLLSMQQGATQIAATESSDVYSFGVVLFETLTGRLPFGPPAECDSPQKAVAAELENRRTATLSRPPHVPRPLFALIRSCLTESATRPMFRDLARQLHRYRNRGRRAKRVAIALGAIGLTGALTLGYVQSRVREPGPGSSPARVAPEPPRTKPELLKHGHAALRHGDWRTASLDFARAFELEPDGKTAATWAYALMLSSQESAALLRAELAVNEFGYREPWALNNYAAALMTTQDQLAPNSAHAIQLANEALERQPDLREARYNLALAEYWHDYEGITQKLRDTRCLTNISRVLSKGARTRVLCQDAAMLYASAGPLYYLHAIELAEEAASRGPSPAPVVLHPHLSRLFKDRPGFYELLFMPHNRGTSTNPNLRWIAPVEE